MSRRAIVAVSAAVAAFFLLVAGGVASLALRAPPEPSSAEGSVPREVVLAREAEQRRLFEEARRAADAQAVALPGELPRTPPRGESGERSERGGDDDREEDEADEDDGGHRREVPGDRHATGARPLEDDGDSGRRLALHREAEDD